MKHDWGNIMERTIFKIGWTVATLVILVSIGNLIPSNADSPNPVGGFIFIVGIVISVLLFRKVAGPKYPNGKKNKKNRFPTIDDFNTPRPTSNYVPAPKPSITRETYEQYKGRLGENRIANVLTPMPYTNRILKNILIEEDGMTHEVDLVFICQSGIYVIESKNFSGWIFGGLNQQNWTQTFANQTKNQFYNPIRQNEGHIKIVENQLKKFGEIDYYSVIVFSDDAVLKSVPRSENRTMILNLKELYDMIKSSIEFNTKLSRGISLDVSKIDAIWSELYQYSLATSEEKHNHIQNVTDFVNAKQES